MKTLIETLILTTPVDTHPAKRHHVESVAAAIDFIKEVTVGEMRCVVHLQLTAGIPEGVKEITLKNFYNRHRNLTIQPKPSKHLLWAGLAKVNC